MLPTRRRQAPYDGDKCDLENSQVATQALHASPDLQEEAQSGGQVPTHAMHAMPAPSQMPACIPQQLCHAMPCLLHHPCHACHALHAMPCHAMPCHAMPCLLHHPCHACHAMPHQLHACLSMQIKAGSPSAAARRKHRAMVRCARQMERCKHAAGPTSWLNGVRIRYEPRMTVPTDGWLRAAHKVMTRDPLRRDGTTVARSSPFNYDWEDPWAVASCLPTLPRLYQCADQSTPGLLPMPSAHHSSFACTTLRLPASFSPHAGAHRSLRRSARSGHGQREGVRSFTIGKLLLICPPAQMTC